MSDSVIYDVRDHVALLTLNRPEARNAFNADLSTALGEALDRADNDKAVRVIVVTGNGPSFSAGADLKAIAAGEDITVRDNPQWGFGGYAQHWIAKPVIAAVNGSAMGGGTELALACDLIVMAADAKLGLPEVKRGLIAGAGGLIRLQRQLPMKRALELALTGAPLDAATALEWGLANRVVEPDQLVDAAVELGRQIAANAPTAVRLSKQLLHETAGADSDWDQAWGKEDPWQVSTRTFMDVFKSPDAMEGPRAFAEKREPRWQD